MASLPSEVVTTYENICNDSSKNPDQKAAALAKLYTPSAVAVFPEGIEATEHISEVDPEKPVRNRDQRSAAEPT